MLTIKKIIPLIVIFLLSIVFTSAAVDFTAESSNPNLNVGDDFNILIKISVPEAETIKLAGFTLSASDDGGQVTLTQGNNAGISGNLLGGFPQLNVVNENIFTYFEGKIDDAIRGEDLLLVTLPVTASTDGDVTFSFSDLSVRLGRTSRQTSSTPLTITINPAEGDGGAGQCQNQLPNTQECAEAPDPDADTDYHLEDNCNAPTACAVTCTPNFGNCDTNNVNGCEVNLQNNNQNCGACGTACGQGEECSEGECEAPASGEEGEECTTNSDCESNYCSSGVTTNADKLCCPVNKCSFTPEDDYCADHEDIFDDEWYGLGVGNKVCYNGQWLPDQDMDGTPDSASQTLGQALDTALQQEGISLQSTEEDELQDSWTIELISSLAGIFKRFFG